MNGEVRAGLAKTVSILAKVPEGGDRVGFVKI
jgi:hypothetical protein